MDQVWRKKTDSEPEGPHTHNENVGTGRESTFTSDEDLSRKGTSRKGHERLKRGKRARGNAVGTLGSVIALLQTKW